MSFEDDALIRFRLTIRNVALYRFMNNIADNHVFVTKNGLSDRRSADGEEVERTMQLGNQLGSASQSARGHTKQSSEQAPPSGGGR